MESVARGGGKSFEGRMRFLPGRAGKQVPVRIGSYGKGPGKWSLKEVREEWDRIRAWSMQAGLDPRELRRQEQKAGIQQHAGPTLEQAAESFLNRSDTRERTKAGYRNMLWNQVLPVLGGSTPVVHFSWDHKHPGGKNGRQVVMDLKADIERRAPVYAVKVLFMSFLRVGSMTPMRWTELDDDQDRWIIPAERMKSGKERVVSLSASLKELLESFRTIYGNEEFASPSPRSRAEGHLDPYSINQHFIRMGY